MKANNMNNNMLYSMVFVIVCYETVCMKTSGFIHYGLLIANVSCSNDWMMISDWPLKKNISENQITNIRLKTLSQINELSCHNRAQSNHLKSHSRTCYSNYCIVNIETKGFVIEKNYLLISLFIPIDCDSSTCLSSMILIEI